jgi:hypothetical protein
MHYQLFCERNTRRYSVLSCAIEYTRFVEHGPLSPANKPPLRGYHTCPNFDENIFLIKYARYVKHGIDLAGFSAVLPVAMGVL